MAQNTDATTDDRSDTKRFTDDVTGDELIQGDRIDTRLVARTFGQLGTQLQHSNPDEETEPKTQLVAITQLNQMDDVHVALLADPDTGTIIRASRHDSQSAWTQKEADWKVREVGTKISIEEVHELELADGENMPDGKSASEYVWDWADVVIVETANGYTGWHDERSMSEHSTLRLRDCDGRKALATISLEG